MMFFLFVLTWRNTLLLNVNIEIVPQLSYTGFPPYLFNEAVSKNIKRRPDCFRILKCLGATYKPCTLEKHT